MIIRGFQCFFIEPQSLSDTALCCFPLRLDYKIKVAVITERVAAAFLQPILVILQGSLKYRLCLRLIVPNLQNLADGQGIQEIVKRHVVKA